MIQDTEYNSITLTSPESREKLQMIKDQYARPFTPPPLLMAQPLRELFLQLP